MTAFLHTATTVNDWLDQQHQSLLANLATRLDIEAGLRETLIPQRHAEFLGTIRRVLDIEAGLAAIVPVPLQPASRAAPATTDSLVELCTELTTLPIEVRLELRIAYAPRVDDALIHVHDVIAAVISILRHPVLQDLDHSSHRGLHDFEAHVWCGIKRVDQNLAEVRVTLLQEVFERVWSVPHSVFVGLPAAWATHLRKLFRSMVHDIDCASSGFESSLLQGISRPNAQWIPVVRAAGGRVRVVTSTLARGLADLEDVLNNFSGEDLRAVDLAGVQLSRLRWSATTQWPEHWREQIQRDSFPVGHGIFEIRGGASTQHGALV
ncbi:hypothetical protein [Nocardia sp. NPDC052566]|uniref:hypothetical protein n=1 Tax=Nocardia sp. NPDC052566 TaxID=3364330 RepID=UPI0037CC53A9